jgi:hypothetical protein
MSAALGFEGYHFEDPKEEAKQVVLRVPLALQPRLVAVFEKAAERLGCSVEDAARLVVADILRHGIEHLESTL